MANEVDYNPCKYKGNGQTVDFPFNWKLIEIDELIVKLENIPTGELTVLKRGVDYTTTKNETGGNVTLTTAPTQDFNIVLSRDTSNYQSTGYSTSTGFQGSEIEKSFDKVSCCLQEQDYNIEDFKNSFTSEINQKIDTNKADTDKQISTNKSDTDNKISEFEAEVNSKLTQVNNAVNQLNRLDEVLEECGNYSDNAKSSAKQANEDVETTTQKMNEIQELYNTATTALTSAQETATTAIDNGKTSALTELEESKNNALTNIKAVSTFVTREIGEIVASTLPLIDAGLHLLDGSVIVGGGIYDQFVQYIAKLYNEKIYTLYAWIYNDGSADYIIYTKGAIPTAAIVLYNSNGTVYTGTEFTNDNGTIKYGTNACTYTESKNVVINNGKFFCSQADWDSSVSTYGVCGKYVYNATDNTVRLPKLTGFIEGTIDVAGLGDITKAGLPNITGTFGSNLRTFWDIGTAIPSTGCLKGKIYTHAQRLAGSTTGDNDNWIVDSIDASASSNVYSDDCDTVQPQSTKVLYYVVIATSTKTPVQMDVDKIATDLNGKANVSADNFNATGTTYLSGLGMPSNRYIDLTLGASGTTYTAPANGWVCIRAYCYATSGWFNIQNENSFLLMNIPYVAIGGGIGGYLPIKKGERFHVDYGNLRFDKAYTGLTFYYSDGVPSA
ncbi:MAG: hypothetical protein SPL73_08120 [Cyanobacteriota bacterium]|nr:hypothetical protein [Cyanobacteriota bacterium]